MSDKQSSTGPTIRNMILSGDNFVSEGFRALKSAQQSKHVHITEKELFFAGAGFVFDAIVHALTQETEPSPEDMLVMKKIHDELQTFHTFFNRKLTP